MRKTYLPHTSSRRLGFLAVLALVVTWPVVALAQQRVPVPVEAMAREPFLSQVQLSPDGEHMVALSSLDGENTQVAIWRTGALDQAPVRFGVGGASARSNVRFAGVTWVSNDRLLVLMQQPVVLGAGADGRFYTAMARIVSLDGRRWVEPMEQGGRRSDLEQFADKFLNIGLLDQLPNDPDHVLMVRSTLDETAIYRVNVNTGRGEPVTRLSERENIAAIVDSRGNPRVKATVDFRDGDWMIGYEVFNPETRRWEAHSALSSGASQRRGLSVLALDPANARYFARATPASRPHFDLPAYVAARLGGAGIGAIERRTPCTDRNESEFFSYRRSQRLGHADYGRQISAIVVA